MAVEDLWRDRDGQPTRRDGRGLRYRVRWRGHPSRSFRTKGAADRYFLRVRTEPALVVSVAAVEDLVSRWLDTKRGLTPKGYEACWGASRHVIEYWRPWLADEVKPSDVRVWLAQFGYSSSLRRKALQCLSGAYRLALIDGHVARNPCDGISVKASAAREARFLSAAELGALAEAAGEWRPMILTLGTTGLRIGEAVALNVGDVDPARRRARVRTSKNGTARDVPVTGSVLALLDLDRPKDAPLFVTETGRRVDVHNWRARVFRPAAVTAGLDGLHPHDLRHTAVSLAIASGADIKAVQKMVGHKTGSLTIDLYGHFFDHGLDDVSARMDRLLGGNTVN